jgi:excisionase family DNA binding protein
VNVLQLHPVTSSDVHALDDAALVALVTGGNEAARLVLIERHSAALREAARDADQTLSPTAIIEIVNALWSSLFEDDMKRLRAFDPSRGAALLAWLTIRLSRLIPRPAESNQEAPTLMRVEEVARRWGIDRKTVYVMIERGQLVSRRCGRLVRIPRKAVELLELQASVSPERER